MKTFKVRGRLGDSTIRVGEDWTRVDAYMPPGPRVIITDENIHRLYGHAFPEAPVITMGLGEKNKTLATVESILRQLIELGCDRSWFVLAIGGGIVCDVAGFAASLFMRGLRFGFVSTTLLSQVDASVGGKNGVNLDAYKNMVGTFTQPEFVICDPAMLKTLPREEISNGLAEIAKHGLIQDKALLEYLEDHADGARALEPEVISRLVADSVAIKSAVVQADETEAGERRKLNFGHTIGHAIEKCRQDGHGKAVSLGMMAAAHFSRKRGLLKAKEVDRIETLLEKLGLPTQLDLDAQPLVDAARQDKKKQGETVFFVFLEALGRARVEQIPYEEMNSFIRTHFI
ncbi:MAG: 3-dehydroquinate synthase [Desulfobacterales bacterium]|nr:3-dehydroquinate synthase [Desulfobacterales bacterium]